MDRNDKEELLKKIGLWDTYGPHIDSIDIHIYQADEDADFDEYLFCSAWDIAEANLPAADYAELESIVYDFFTTAASV